jgi:hypothetical protein
VNSSIDITEERRADMQERRAEAAEAKLRAVQVWAADNYMEWLRDKPLTGMDWDDLREALGVKRLGP